MEIKSVRIAVVLLFSIELSACDNGASDVPGPSALPTSPSATASWTVTGQVVSNPGGLAIPEASIDMDGVTVTTDANGAFLVSAAAASTRQLRISAPGHVTRDTRLDVSSPREGVTIDLISLAPPFSLEFYRQLARSGLYEPPKPVGLRPIKRWETAPSFYIQTTDETGRAVDPGISTSQRRSSKRAYRSGPAVD